MIMLVTIASINLNSLLIDSLKFLIPELIRKFSLPLKLLDKCRLKL